MNPECPKCGARMVGPRYERGLPDHPGVALDPERLRYRCTCGYSITTPTKDAKRAAPAGGQT